MNKPQRRKRAALPVPAGPQPVGTAPAGANLEAPPLPGLNAPAVAATVEALWNTPGFRDYLLKREDIKAAIAEGQAWINKLNNLVK